MIYIYIFRIIFDASNLFLESSPSKHRPGPGCARALAYRMHRRGVVGQWGSKDGAEVSKKLWEIWMINDIEI